MTNKLFNDAIKLLEKGKNDKALALFEQVIKRNPNHYLGLHFYGLLSISALKFDQGVGPMNRAMQAQPGNQTFRANQLQAGQMALSKQNLAAAIDLLQMAHRHHPSDLAITVQLAKAFLLSKKIDTAFSLLKDLPDNTDFFANFYLATARLLMTHAAKAKRHMLKALQIMPLHKHGPINGKPDGQLKVLVCYATESFPFRPIINNGDIAFSFDSGHFDVGIFLSRLNINLDRLFISDCQSCHAALENVGEYDLLINVMADPEITRKPLQQLQDALDNSKTKLPGVINLPKQVLSTNREDVYEQLHALEHVVMATTWQLRVEADEDKARQQFSDIATPFLLRPLGSSTGVGLEKIEHIAESSGILGGLIDTALNICPFIDFKSADGHYRKYRVFVINGEIFPEHCVVSDHWNVHSSSRFQLMQYSQQFRAEEQDFVLDIKQVLKPQHISAIKKIAELLKLDYFGIDFSFTDTGELLVFEANSGMRVNPDYLADFPYLQAPIVAIISAFQKLIVQRSA